MKFFRGRKPRDQQNPQRSGEIHPSVPVTCVNVDHPSNPQLQRSISDTDIRETMTRWSQGLDSGAGRQLIGYFHRQMEQPEHDPELLLEFIGHVFRRMVVEGMTADQAFGLNDPEPEAPLHTDISPEHRAIALTIEHQKRFDPYRGALKRAYVIAADSFGVTSARARDIHTAGADWLATLSDKEIREALLLLKR